LASHQVEELARGLCLLSVKQTSHPDRNHGDAFALECGPDGLRHAGHPDEHGHVGPRERPFAVPFADHGAVELPACPGDIFRLLVRRGELQRDDVAGLVVLLVRRAHCLFEADGILLDDDPGDVGDALGGAEIRDVDQDVPVGGRRIDRLPVLGFAVHP